MEGKPFRITGSPSTERVSQCRTVYPLMQINENCKNFRIDHCKFRTADQMIEINGVGDGLGTIARLTAMQSNGSNVQTIWIRGPGIAPNYRKPLSLGTADAIYFEDNEVYKPVADGQTRPATIPDGPTNGARVVIRHNTLVNSQLEIYRPGVMKGFHGCQSAEGPRYQLLPWRAKAGRRGSSLLLRGWPSSSRSTFNCTIPQLPCDRPD